MSTFLLSYFLTLFIFFTFFLHGKKILLTFAANKSIKLNNYEKNSFIVILAATDGMC